MGIKFRCPNGHKLNVKSFLAGKKGVCPKCGTRMRIPAASEEAAGDSDIGEMAMAAAVVQEAAPAARSAPGAVPALPAATAAPAVFPVTPIQPRPVTPVLPAPALPVGAPVMPAAPAMPVAMPAMPMGPMPGMPAAAPAMPLPGVAMPLPPAVAAGDPIAEAPAASWYVRPPSGVQYGPARGDVMRKWIAEGRVSSDSLVWREGWPDWKNAGQVFPHLAAAATPAGPLGSVATAPVSTRTVSRYQAQRKSGSGMAVAFLVVLALVCVVLVGVLIYVLTTAT